MERISAFSTINHLVRKVYVRCLVYEIMLEVQKAMLTKHTSDLPKQKILLGH